MDNGLILMQHLPSTWTGSEQWDITHHQCTCFRFHEDLNAEYPPEAIGVVYEYD